MPLQIGPSKKALSRPIPEKQTCATVKFSAITLFCYLLALSHLKVTISKPEGFILELIHRDSPQSPLYPGNLSLLERFKRLVQVSDSHISHLHSLREFHSQNSTIFNPNTVRPKVIHEAKLYIIKLNIGSKPVTNYLVLDTGSDFVWTQCKGDTEFFRQTSELYDPKASASYRKLPCNQCIYPGMQCINGECAFAVSYINGAAAKGIASLENFGFEYQNNSIEYVNSLVFGCAYDGKGMPFNGKTSGILGLDMRGLSFVNQLASQGVPKRFSHCFIKVADETTARTFLRFGTDIPHRGPLQTTSLVPHPIAGRYAVNLLGISVGAFHLDIPPTAFAINQGQGGCLMDSGSPLTYIVTSAYKTVSNYMVQYFRPFGISKIEDRALPLPDCFTLKEWFDRFPAMTFHFQGADLKVNQNNVFFVVPQQKIFCLTMKPDDKLTTIGAYQLQNTRVICNVAQMKISFGPENCARDAL